MGVPDQHRDLQERRRRARATALGVAAAALLVYLAFVASAMLK